MLKRNPSLTDQAKAHIKQQILDNQFEDERIPSEMELAESLGVSRTTIRDALSRLENEGVVFRKQGAGTFVNRPGLRIKSRLEEIWSYEAVLRDHGYIPSTRVLDVRSESAESPIAEELGLTPGEDLLVVEKIFLEDEQPVIYTRNHLPKKLIEESFELGDFELPVFEFMARFGQLHLSYYLSEIVPVKASGSIADSLRVPESTALISLDEIGYSEENTPMLKAYSYFRDDLLRLRLIRRKVP